MGPLLALLIFIASSSSLPAGKSGDDVSTNPTYKFRSSANVLVEYKPGVTATAVQPHLFLRIEDPTNNLVCKILQFDFVVFFIPPSSIPTFIKNPVSRTVRLEKELNTQSDNTPWIIFLKKENVYELPSYYRKINITSGNADDPWELGAYTLAPPGSVLAAYPEDVQPAPPPFYPSLCVSPDRPKPFPVLFAPSSQTPGHASVASFTDGDLIPTVVGTPVIAASMPLPVSPTIVATAPSAVSVEDSPSAQSVDTNSAPAVAASTSAQSVTKNSAPADAASPSVLSVATNSAPAVAASTSAQSVAKTSAPADAASPSAQSVAKNSSPAVAASPFSQSVAKSSAPAVAASPSAQSVAKNSAPADAASPSAQSVAKNSAPAVAASPYPQSLAKNSAPADAASPSAQSVATSSAPAVAASPSAQSVAKNSAPAVAASSSAQSVAKNSSPAIDDSPSAQSLATNSAPAAAAFPLRNL